MISVDHVTKTYGKSNKPAVDDLTFSIQPGEIVGFLGPNGAGKTTTISMLVGITKPDKGKITIHGVDVLRNPVEAKRLIGYVPDSTDPFVRLTGREYVRFMADVYGVSQADRDKRLPELLRTFDMEGAFDDRISSYSRGMKQKVSIIGALIHDPLVWMLDEPMVGLDPKATATLKAKMRAHCDEGKITFFSTHGLDVAERVCDRVIIIHGGRIIASGTVEELRNLRGEANDSSLEKLFLELTNG
ncbi:ABC transporter ATP-binding protein [Alicyclobacillus fodiniaquatilis]|uniref:ABC transporter ATP-binding protein n=1 Tax=Alicyclobacillus fodiniaquatilis TaxID=1661150 RepID=A0ABW4JCB8_9BACL